VVLQPKVEDISDLATSQFFMAFKELLLPKVSWKSDLQTSQV
jgi:hypothetical protein